MSQSESPPACPERTCLERSRKSRRIYPVGLLTESRCSHHCYRAAGHKSAVNTCCCHSCESRNPLSVIARPKAVSIDAKRHPRVMLPWPRTGDSFYYRLSTSDQTALRSAAKTPECLPAICVAGRYLGPSYLRPRLSPIMRILSDKNGCKIF
jgi:hypothetical protein